MNTLVKKLTNNKKGITLMALVVTIIILLILAGISIGMLSGDNSIIKQAGNAKTQTDIAQEKEILEQATVVAMGKSKYGNVEETDLKKELENVAEVTTSGSKFKVKFPSERQYLIDQDGNIIEPLPEIKAGERAPDDKNATYTDGKHTAIIPAGFTVSNINGETEIEKGLVIKDDNENEFIWIPVGIAKENVTIELGRYIFANDGTPSPYTGTYTEDTQSSHKSNFKNMIAKDIEEFISSANTYEGYYIGRFWAKVEGYTEPVLTSNDSSLASWTGYTNGKLSVKIYGQVFDYITQNKAAELSRSMYNNINFESDLMNSYALETALLFYSKYVGNDISKWNLKFSSNLMEWLTETTGASFAPCGCRSTRFGFYTLSTRGGKSFNDAGPSQTFRPIIYIN